MIVKTRYHNNRCLAQKHMGLKYGMNEYSFKRLHELWMEFGMTGHDSESDKNKKANHYFLQEIVEHSIIDYVGWHIKLSKGLLDIIKSEFPMLVGVRDKSFCSD